MARTFPAVVVHGILESGKTKFIVDSLRNEDFGDLGKVLILSMEEGEEEYDPAELAKYNACVYTFASQDEFTVEKINELIKVNKPHAVFFEMNAMWDQDKIKFPPYILVEQSFTIIDASTFKVYFNNMRQKFVDMITASDIVIMNRAEDTAEMAGYKRNLRLVNKDATILALGEDDKPFGIFYIDTFENRPRYEGKIVEFDCMTVTSRKLPKNTFIAGRLAMTCCANDIQLLGHLCALNQPMPVVNKQWIHLRARVHYLDEQGKEEPQIVLEYLSSHEIPEIAEPVVSLTN